MEPPKEHASRWIVPLGALLVPLFVLWLVFLEPRPFHIYDLDQEHGYFFDSLSLARGYGVPANHDHPGTPAAMLGAALILLLGTDIGSLQAFLNVAYLVCAAITYVCLLVGFRLLHRGFSAGSKVLVLGTVFGWPALMTYLGYFGCEMYIIPTGFLLVCTLWPALLSEAPVSRARLYGVAILGALGMALKITFLPMLVAVGAALALRLLLEREVGWPARLRRVLGTVLVFVASFLLFCLPALPALPHIFLRIFHFRPDTGMAPMGLGHQVSGLLNSFSEVVPLAILLLALGLFLAWMTLGLVRPRTLSWLNDSENDAVAAGSPPLQQRLPLVVLCGLTMLALIYTLMAARFSSWDLGHILRNVTPAYMGCLAILLSLLWWLDKRWDQWRSAPVQAAAVGFALALVATAGWQHVQARRELLRVEGARQAAFTADRAELPERLLVWERLDGKCFMGAPSFLHWGNYRYGADRFSSEIRELYPEYELLRLREIIIQIFEQKHGFIPYQRSENPVIERLNSASMSLRPDLLNNVLPWSSLETDPVVFPLEHPRVPILLLVSEFHAEARDICTPEEFEAFLETRMGPLQRETLELAGAEFWLFQPAADSAAE